MNAFNAPSGQRVTIDILARKSLLNKPESAFHVKNVGEELDKPEVVKEHERFIPLDKSRIWFPNPDNVARGFRRETQSRNGN
jgi:hypothetical protein